MAKVYIAVLLTFLLGILSPLSRSASPVEARSGQENIPNQYIVVLKDDENPDTVSDDLVKKEGISRKHIYRNRLQGFSANMTAEIAQRIKNDSRVKLVSEDHLVQVAATEAGDGLKGDYFDNKNLTNIKFTRVDPTINFDWALGSPASSIAVDTYSVRWSGQILAPNTETYTFYTKTDDGVRLWVNNQRIINWWYNQSATERSGKISLTGGQIYNIKMEYYENTGNAVAQLSWSSPTIAKTLIPQSYLFSSAQTPSPSPSPTPTPTPIPTPSPSPSPSTQVIPTGIARAGVNSTNTGSGITVAVIDTGIQLNHPDLTSKIVASTNCINPGASANDGHGHGTHVAGIVSASDNNFGVVGVSPNVNLAAVKVLDDQGYGTWSSVICGIDWVTANTSAYNIKVANLSLGGGGTSDNNCGLTNGDALHLALCNSASAGITYVVAAGNDGVNANTFVPAAYDDAVITVSALSDSDGKSGGTGSSTWAGADDTFAYFSNYGNAVDLGAPGVDIYSTYKGSGYTNMSGTSMASPHVSGAAALYIKSNPGLNWTQVRNALKALAENLGLGHSDPSGLHPEPVLKTSSL